MYQIVSSFMDKKDGRLTCHSEPKLTRRQLLAGAGVFALLGTRSFNAGLSSRVVVIKDWQPGAVKLSPSLIKRVFDQVIAKLTDSKNVEEEWSKLFPSGSKVSIKIDTRSPLAATSSSLISAVLEILFNHLIQPWDITLWDKRFSDINRMAYQINTRRGTHTVTATEPSNCEEEDSTGYKKNRAYIPNWLEGKEGKTESLFSSNINRKNACIINLPALKHHPLVGIDGALVSLAIGSVNNTSRYYSSTETLARAVAEIWKHKQLSGHRLTIMDAGNLIFNGGPVGLPSWKAAENSLIIGFDPVAVDSVALDLINKHRLAAKLPSCAESGKIFLDQAEKLGVGDSKPAIIRINI